jgi:hypothetical protein
MRIGKGELWLCGLLAACGGGGSGASSNSGPASVAEAPPPILLQHCSACHAPPSAKEHNSEEWPSVIERMNLHRLEARMPSLDGKDKQAVLAYLQSNAKQ